MLRKYHAHICFVLVAGTLLVAYPPHGARPVVDEALQQAALQFTQISHRVEAGAEQGGGTPMYVSGPQDWKFVAFYATVCTLARYVVNEVVLETLASVGGVKPEKRGRFKDQGWQGLYYLVAWLCGFSLLRGTEWGQAVMAGDPNPLFQDYPKGHVELSAEFKLYYLLQLCFWVHQLFVLYIEEWRKDMPLYLFHHFITIGLISASYLFNFTRVGTAILVEQDFADIFLPIALMLKYLEWETACEAFFAIFAVAWIPTRHVILPWIYYRIWTVGDDPSLNMSDWDPASGSYMSAETIRVFLIALGIFQVLLAIWLKDLLFSIYRAVTSGEKED